MFSNRIKHPYPPPSHTLQGGGEGWTREKVRGQRGNSSQSWVKNNNIADSSLLYNYNKHLPRSPFTGKFFEVTRFSFGVLIVN